MSFQQTQINVLDGKLDTSNPDLQANASQMESLLKTLRERVHVAKQGGGEKAIKVHCLSRVSSATDL